MAKNTHTPDGPAETPLERAERQIRGLKSESESPGGWAELTESGKLDRLDKLDWQGVTPLERLSVIETEVDLNRVSPRTQRNYLGGLRDQVMATLPPSPAPPVEAEPAPMPSPADLVERAGPPPPRVTGGQTPRPRL
jgi:hypothetical protein